MALAGVESHLLASPVDGAASGRMGPCVFLVIMHPAQPSKARLGGVHFILHPAQTSEARLGGVHLIFRHIQICTRLLQSELFKVTMYSKYTAHISSNGSHFLRARVLVH